MFTCHKVWADMIFISLRTPISDWKNKIETETKQKQKQKNKKEYDCFNLSVDHQRDRPFDNIIEREGLQA